MHPGQSFYSNSYTTLTSQSPYPYPSSQTQTQTLQPIPTIKQIYQQLKQSYYNLDQIFKDIGIAPLSLSEDLEHKKITINKIIANIPSQQQLLIKLRNANKQSIKDAFVNYRGDNQLILKARANFGEIKKQQQKIYYLAADCAIPSVSPQFKLPVNLDNIANLASYKDVTQIKKTKSKVLQKNTLSVQYFQQGQAELDQKINQPIIKSTRKNQQLKQLDLLVHVNFYDSHNSQKQYQFVCVQEQNLKSLVDKFKCLIDTLSNIEQLRKCANNQGQNYSVYDKFYQQPITVSSQKQSPQSSSHSSSSSLKYLVIQDTIYYQGNRSNLQPLLSLSRHKQQSINYRTLQISKTKLCDLRVIFGKPYLYRHLQGCDHIVIFKQARLFMGNSHNNNSNSNNSNNINGQCSQFNDIVQIDKYPITVYEAKMKRRKCQACGIYFCDFAVIGDLNKNNGQNLYVCAECYRDLHQGMGVGMDGKNNVGTNGKVIHYIHD